MSLSSTGDTGRRVAVPRGLLATGPVILSYGFRPFFLLGALWAIIAMALWIATLLGVIAVGGSYGAAAWHGHEMLFGFGPAIVAGFLLTAVPNWTGRLPVAGRPLGALVSVWLAGRLAMLSPDWLGPAGAAALDLAFLPVLLAVCVREIVKGRKWSDLKVMAALGALSLANLCYHVETIAGDGPDRAMRLALATYTMMIIIIGGRIIPSFSRNWLAKEGETRFPVPFGRFDTIVAALTVPACLLWVLEPEGALTAAALVACAGLHAARLSRWRGLAARREPLLFVLHASYAFIPLALANGAAAAGLTEASAAMHVMTVGTVATMMLSVMARATRGHTGHALTASPMTMASHLSLFGCAIARPMTALLPEATAGLHTLAAALWLLAFGLFIVEYGPMLSARRKPSARSA